MRMQLFSFVRRKPFWISSHWHSHAGCGLHGIGRHYHTSNIVQGPSLFRRLRSAAQNIRHGDDHINPKKILERKYLYFTLLAAHLRNLRLTRDRQDGAVSKETNLELQERATLELDAKGLDTMSNVELRHEVQDLLQHQVNPIFGAFQKVDNRLQLTSKYEDESRNFEAEIDILRSEHILTKETLERARTDVDGKTLPASISFLQLKIEAIEELLHFHGVIEKTTPSCTHSLDAFGTDVANTSSSSLIEIRKHQTLNVCRSALIREQLGYSVLSLRSSIPNGGRGVFLDGSATAGSLTAFQPGDVWPKEHLLTTAPDVMDHFAGEDDCQISLRFDEYVVDSRLSPVTVLTREESKNPWALGNMINHPKAPTLPNCQSTMLNFTAHMNLGDHTKYIPNTYGRVPSWKSRFFDDGEILMHGLCLVLKRDVTNEELLYDYRLQTSETPAWYDIVRYNDGLDDEQVVFFRDDWKPRDDRENKND